MEPLRVDALRPGARVLLDTPPIIYHLQGHKTLGPRFAPLFERHAEGDIEFAITTIGLAEVLAGPLAAGADALVTHDRDLRRVKSLPVLS